jgi:hypothetical protein
MSKFFATLFLFVLVNTSIAAIDFIPKYYSSGSLSKNNFPSYGSIIAGPNKIKFESNSGSIIYLFSTSQDSIPETILDYGFKSTKYFRADDENETTEISNFKFEFYTNDSIIIIWEKSNNVLRGKIRIDDFQGLYLYPTCKQRLPLLTIYTIVLISPFILLGFLLF